LICPWARAYFTGNVWSERINKKRVEMTDLDLKIIVEKICKAKKRDAREVVVQRE